MTVKQIQDQNGPSALTIYFAEKASDAAIALANEHKTTDSFAPALNPNEASVVLDVRNHTYKQIWDRVRLMTNAQLVRTSAEDLALQKKLEAITEKAGPDRARMQAILQAKKDQARMLAVARGEVDKGKA